MSSKVAVLVPVASVIEPECEAALLLLAQRGYHVRTFRGCSQVDQARSELATAAFDDGFQETLWIDSDVAFTVEDVERLRSHNLPFCAGLYPKKGIKQFACKFLNPGQYRFGNGGGLIEVEYVGMGFVLIRREVYRACEELLLLPRCTGSHTGKPVIPYFAPSICPDGEGWCYLADDFSMCHRARQAGFKIMVDTTIKLGHVGKHVYTWDDFALQRYETLELNIPGR